jgi:hypothetical protein
MGFRSGVLERVDGRGPPALAPVLPENAKVNLPRPPLEFLLNGSRPKPGCAVPGFPEIISAVANVGLRGGEADTARRRAGRARESLVL